MVFAAVAGGQRRPGGGDGAERNETFVEPAG